MCHHINFSAHFHTHATRMSVRIYVQIRVRVYITHTHTHTHTHFCMYKIARFLTFDMILQLKPCKDWIVCIYLPVFTL